MANKYDIVKEGLKKLILSGDYEVNDRLPTESELMAEYGVSRYTIRRAMQDLEGDHYIYRIQGGGMFVDDWRHSEPAKSSDRNIGVITTHLTSYIFPQIVSGIDDVISEQGYSLILSNTHNDPSRERKALVSLMGKSIDGFIVEPTQSALNQENLDLYRELEALHIPVVFINAKYAGLNAPSLTTDDTQAMRDITNYLIEQGHERILGVFQVDDNQGVDRMDGFMQAYRQHPQLSIYGATMMYQTSDSRATLMKRIGSLLTQPQESRPTAVVAYNDQIAIRILDLANSLGLKVPEDLSVVGFDDYTLSKYMTPSLTTLRHVQAQMGRDAATMLLKMIRGEAVASIQYPAELILRNSTSKLD